MASQLQPGDSCAFVIFGAMGDLTKRKLLPSLYNLRANGLLPKNVVIVGVARRPLDNGSYREHANQVLRDISDDGDKDNPHKKFRNSQAGDHRFHCAHQQL